MRPLRAITFDLDETMLDRRATFERFIRRQMRRHSAFFEEVDEGSYFRRVLELDRDGHTPKPEVFAGAAEEHGLPTGAAAVLADDFEDRFPDDCVMYPGALVTLEHLKDRRIRLAVITNGGSTIQRRKLEGMGVTPLFDHLSISEEMGCSKPDPAIFVRTLEHLEVDPADAVHVGDHPRADIAGAKAAGLRAVWVGSKRWPEAPEADLVIDGIAALPDALAGLQG